MTSPRHDGVSIEIGGREWVVAPLNIRLLRHYLPRLAALGRERDGMVTAEEIETLTEVIHAALARNYPDLTLAEVEDMLDLQSIETVFAAVCGASGLAPRAIPSSDTGSAKAADVSTGEEVAGNRAR